jgi:hypothetical protein
MLSPIISAVTCSVTRDISSAPQSTQRKPGMRSSRTATACLSARSSPQMRTSCSKGCSRSCRCDAATVCNAETTPTPSGTSSAACWAAEPCHTPRVRVAAPPTAAARGTVASMTTWPARRLGRSSRSVSWWLAKGMVSTTTSPAAAASALRAAENSAAGTSRRSRATASSARWASREPMTTGSPAWPSRSARPRPRSPDPPMMLTGPMSAPEYMVARRGC